MNSSSPPTLPVAGRAPLSDHLLVTSLLNIIPDSLYFKDRKSRFTAMNAAFVKVLGQNSKADILGKTDFDFFDKIPALAAYEEEQTIINSGQPMLGKFEKKIWPDGRVTWVYTKKFPLLNPEGEIIGTFGFSRNITQTKELETTLEKKHQELVCTSRAAGKAEVATGVLHNVGNVLNSLNVSASVIATGFRQSKTESLAKLCQLLRDHGTDLGNFITVDPKGKKIPEFIDSLAQHFHSERDRLLQELTSLQANIDHIKEIVSMQQAYATTVGTVETLQAASLMEDALHMNSTALERHVVHVVRDFQAVPPVIAEKNKVLQILVNLIRNSKYACDETGRPDKTMTLSVGPGEPGYVRLIVQDNGIGIAPENLKHIFQHGFTTKATGHGFGIHSSALAAKEMKGFLTVYSEGIGQGAAFTLELPTAPRVPQN